MPVITSAYTADQRGEVSGCRSRAPRGARWAVDAAEYPMFAMAAACPAPERSFVPPVEVTVPLNVLRVGLQASQLVEASL